MFTLEIGGKAVAVTDADEATARELFESEEFREDLKSLSSDGQPIWDGKAAFNIRQSNKDESDEFAAADFADDDYEDEDEDDAEDSGATIMFLVAIDDEDEED